MNRSKSLFQLAVRVFILTAFFVSTFLQPHAVPPIQASYHPNYAWSYQEIDTNSTPNNDFDLELDSQGLPHIAYYSPSENKLLYRAFDGTSWELRLEIFGSMDYVSLELDSSDHPHISYYITTSGIASYTAWDGNAWSAPIPIGPIQQVHGQYTSLALSDSGIPYVAYNDFQNASLKLAILQDGAFVSQIVDDNIPSGGAFNYISLALDANDTPHIAYCAGAALDTCTELRYATWTGSWDREIVDATAGAGYNASLALSSTNIPHILYRIPGNSLQYAYKDGSTWQKIETGSDTSSSVYSALALDSNDAPHFAFFNGGELQYRFWDGSAWSDLMNPHHYEAGAHVSLELDAQDNPHMAYADDNLGSLAYARYQPAADLAIAQFWADDVDNRLVTILRNDGLGPYAGDVQIWLYVNEAYQGHSEYTLNLAAGEVFSGDLPIPSCTPPTVQVKVCLTPYGTDTDNSNNCLIETWPCDSTPPIISNLTISAITASSFTADWTTNEPSQTRLTYGTGPGRQLQTYTDATLKTNHHVVINGLHSHTAYTVQAHAENINGLRSTSHSQMVRTLATAGSPPAPPTLTVERESSSHERYNLQAQYPDTANIQRVEFLFDGTLIGTDYTPADGRFNVMLEPARSGYSREAFFSPHQVIVQAYTQTGQVFASNPLLYQPLAEPTPMQLNTISPTPEATLYIAGTTVPAGTSQLLSAFAEEYEWVCDWANGNQGPPNCNEVAGPINLMRFYVNGNMLGEDATAENGVYNYTWDLSGKSVGDYNLRFVAYGHDGSSREQTILFHIVQGQPDLQVSRVVTRQQQLFKVNVNISNSADATYPVTVTGFQDNAIGFQVVAQGFESWQVKAEPFADGQNTTATITLDPQRTLNPGEALSFHYYLVPILYRDAQSQPYIIAAFDSAINYKFNGANLVKLVNIPTTTIQDSAAPNGQSQLSASMQRAFASSDYLIITDPYRLFRLYNQNDVKTLLGNMARLASLKQGVLAYWNSDIYNKDVLNTLLQDNSLWTNRLHPNFGTRGNGYVLFVGETEIIPAYTTGPYSLYWTGSDPDEYNVKDSDNPYAHTDGNGAPDLILGRILGNSASALNQGVMNSIQTDLGNSYERVQAYVGSGVGNGESGMQGDANTVTNTLTGQGYSVSKHHWEEEAFLHTTNGINFMSHDGLAHGDVDGDNNEEIILASRDDQVYYIKPYQDLLSTAFSLDFEEGDSLAAGDVNNDGVTEIIIGDRNDTIRTYNLFGTQLSSFNQNFQAWDRIAVGNVLSSNPGAEIVMADYSNSGQDYLHIFTYTGTPLGTLSITNLGYNFADHDILRTGSVSASNPWGLDEIIFTDRTNDKIVGISANGDFIFEFDIDVDRGDNMEVANVYGSALDEVIFADRDNSIRTYQIQDGTGHQVLSTYADVEEYDGLVLFNTNTFYDNIIHADRADRLRVVDLHYPDYSVSLFENSIADADLIWFQAHGWAGGMGPAINVENFPVSFSGAHPIVNAWSCTTGHYEGNGDNSIAEAFLKSGAGIYVGATEVSPMSKNSNTSRKLYRDYWTSGQDFGESFLRFKNDRWEVSEHYDWWWYLINEYNIYGDPKFDIMGDTTLNSPEHAAPLSPQTSLVLDLPMYTIESNDGIDRVEIPGGQLYQDSMQYEVPTYLHTIEIPAGQQVQDVTLTARGNLSSAFGLNLPIADMSTTGITQPRSAVSLQQLSQIAGHDWSPNFEQPFTWSVSPNADGSSSLALVLYPFYYDAAAQYVEYYQHYEFEIQTSETTTTIVNATTDQTTYPLGQPVMLDLLLRVPGEPQNLIVSATIRHAGSGEIVDGFEFAMMENLTGEGNVTLTWDSSAATAGDYQIELQLLDFDNTIVSRRFLNFTLGQALLTAQTLNVTPTHFRPGNSIQAELHFANTGDLTLDGLSVIEVQTADGQTIATFSQDFNNLPTNEPRVFSITWDSTAAEEGDYRIIAYVQYNSQSTPLLSAALSTQSKLYLPSIVR